MPTNAKAISSAAFPQVYDSLGIDVSLLGAVMLDVTPPVIEIPQEFRDALYFSQNASRFWISGYVLEDVPHLTLLYGLMRPAPEWQSQIDEVLKGWSVDTVQVKHVSFFNSPYADDPYYCLVAHIEPSPALIEGNQRLQLLPHINTFPVYSPHVTIAYVRKDEATRNKMIHFFHTKLKGRSLKVTGLNLGGNH